MLNLLTQAELGTYKSCEDCPWNPKIHGSMAFGTSCREHAADWTLPGSVLSMQIVQDPAGTTPQKTGRLCSVHNSRNPTDKTAQHGHDLWNASVSFDIDEGIVDPYLKKHYWTNALLHGADKKNSEMRKSRNIELVRKKCSVLLDEQIHLLSPNVIISNGKIAASSLLDLRLVSKNWSDIRKGFSQGVYEEESVLPSGREVRVFCTYHTSIQPVNTCIAKLYSTELQVMLDNKLNEYLDFPRVRFFLDKYPADSQEGRGMRVLLLHWLDIGKAVRVAY